MKEDKKKVAISVVIPIFNEEGNLDALCRELTETLENLHQSYELVFVDDGSMDGGVELLKKWKVQNPNIKVIRFLRNFGQHLAVMAGLKYCSGEKVATMDADLQNDPTDIPSFLKKLDEGYDVVSGWRAVREDSLFRRVVSRIVNKVFSRLSGTELKDHGCMLRAYNRSIIDRIIEVNEPFVPLNALSSWLRARILEVNVSHRERVAGKSKYGLLKLLRVYFDMVTGLSIAPIQVISLIGILVSSIGFLAGGYLIFLRILFGSDVWGARSLFALMTIFFGLLLLSLGVIGEYVARIYMEVRRRPDYIIQEIIE